MIQQRVGFYRLHFISRQTGTIARTHQFYADDDAAAVKLADVWREYAPMELWGPKGLVRRWRAIR